MCKIPGVAAMLVAASILSACARRPPAAVPPLFPVTALWKAPLPDFVSGPLAADDSHVFVATRDGAVQAFGRANGELLWRLEKRGDVLGSANDVLLVRTGDGIVSRLRSRSGETLWTAETGVQGSLPPVVDGDMTLVAGNGLVSLETASGNILWSVPPGTIATTVPVPAGSRILVGESEGLLRCRDRATGTSLWTFRLRSAPLAAPLVAPERRVFLGTTDRRFLSLSLDRGQPGWTWKVGADVQSAPIAYGDTVVFAALDGVLYALKRKGGNLVWRALLPSRPLAAPALVGSAILVACAENDILGFDARTGARLGGLKTAAEIRTPPVVRGGQLYVGLRDRSVAAIALAASPEAAPASPPAPKP